MIILILPIIIIILFWAISRKIKLINFPQKAFQTPLYMQKLLDQHTGIFHYSFHKNPHHSVYPILSFSLLFSLKRVRFIQFTYQRQYKIALLGDESVGKTSIIKRFIDEKYEEILMKTIGVSITHKLIKCQDRLVKFDLFDLSGQEKYYSIAPCVYNHSHAILLCFDLCNRQSFQNLCKYWFQEVETHVESNCLVYLVGNKIDKGERQVEDEEIEKIAHEKGIKKIYLMSAKTGVNIEETFIDIASHLSEISYQNHNEKFQVCKLQSHKKLADYNSKCYKS